MSMADDTPKPKDPEYLSTLERGLKVLNAFDAGHPELQLSEVATITGLSPAVARRCLHTLLELGYVGKNGRRFILKPKVLEFGSAYLNSMNLEQVATPYLQKLRDQTGDSSSLSVLSGHDILYLVHVSTERKIRLGASVGTRFPVHATSLGRALMAYQRDSIIDQYIDTVELRKFTEHTITAKAELEKRLRKIRQQGYDSAQDELDYGIVSVAVPIFDSNRQVIASINCSTSTTRVSREKLIEERLPLLQDAAIEIELALKKWPFLANSLQG
ncbi:IclR family transcriptional regulator domain-containing protein [Kordiimonas sp.]|uniref:IclR family transcriptional regulator domain-containing protein n=1 Tax=Kordiimonas sp. TaxID=1970157 RepID=UPI003A927783